MRLNHLANSSDRRRAFAFAAMVGALMCLSAGSAGAGPITCTGAVDADPLFPGESYRCESQIQSFDTGTTSETYIFDGFHFTNTLSFDAVLHQMDVTMSAFFVDLGNPVFLSRLPAGAIPEPFLTSDGFKWIYFRIEDLGPQSGPPQNGVDFSGDWHQEFAWIGDGTYVNPQMLHDNRPLNIFDAVITDPGSFCDECGPSRLPFAGDPTIGGSARDFSDTTTVSEVVPEPASLLLLGSGLGSAWYRRRRQRALAARDSA